MGMKEDLFDKRLIKALIAYIAIQAVVLGVMAILHAFVGDAEAVPETTLRQCLCSCDE